MDLSQAPDLLSINAILAKECLGLLPAETRVPACAVIRHNCQKAPVDYAMK